MTDIFKKLVSNYTTCSRNLFYAINCFIYIYCKYNIPRKYNNNIPHTAASIINKEIIFLY